MISTRSALSAKMLRRSCQLTQHLFNRQAKRSIVMARLNQARRKDSTTLFKPVPVKDNSENNNVGEELCGSLNKLDVMKTINEFIEMPQIQKLAKEAGLDDSIRNAAFKNFQMYCLKTPALPSDLHVSISDILQGAGHIADIFPYFMRYTKQIYPHLDCLPELKKISDLRNPAAWYPLARSMTRKIIFHAGPTNSGKTYHALQRFMEAGSGVYCGPLKLLVSEVFHKSNKMGTPCDLLTGEERRFANVTMEPAPHISCSVEMVNVDQEYEVAVIDEIQMIRDPGRGYAWTRALLGLAAKEVHLCGESATLNLVKSICAITGEDVQIHKYKRLTPLFVESKALKSFKFVQPGDCIVCFSKNDIFTVSQELERSGKKIAVIYGSLPPGAKLAQAERFNDPSNPCKVLVATNAIGMGLNLHIRRVIFYSLVVPTVNEKGEVEKDTISVSSALQIAGRAGRFSSNFPQGYVTTYRESDLPILQKLLAQTPDEIRQAGLHPTADQIELYAYHLPHASLSNLMEIFVALCTLDDSLFFICNIDDFKFLAEMIEHVPLSLKTRYLFCCAPLNKKFPYACTMFLKFARQCSKNENVTFKWLCEQIGWPFSLPKNIVDLIHLESVFDVLDLYLWLSYRFPEIFTDNELVRDMQRELDKVIEAGVIHVTQLLGNHKKPVVIPRGTEEDFEIQTKKHKFLEENCNSNSNNLTEGKLSKRLLEQGLLTREMLQELHSEWAATKLKKKKW